MLEWPICHKTAPHIYPNEPVNAEEIADEAVLERVQSRLDHNPDAMCQRRSTTEHPFGTIKCWMGWTHFLCTTLPKVATEMSLNVLAYNMKRVMKIIGVGALLEAMAR